MSETADEIYNTARTKKGFRARQSILAHASQLLGDFGPAAVTVSAICEAAQISRSAFYNYFASAEDAVDVLGKTFVEEITEQFDRLHQDRPRGLERLAYCLRFIQEMAARDPEWGKLIIQIQGVSPEVEAKLVQEVGQEIKAARKNGETALTTAQMTAFLTMAIATILRNCNDLALGKTDREIIGPSIFLILRAAGVEASVAKKFATAQLKPGALGS